MEGNMSTSTLQQREFEEINTIIPTLWKQGLLTDIECRIIASYHELEEKKGALYTVIMAKRKEEAAVLMEIFRKMNECIHVEEKTSSHEATDCSNEEKNHSILASKNPFLNNMIIKHLFGYLPLKEMKQSRLVCHIWNSTAEICLRKRSAIHFRENVLMPDTFIQVSKYSHPDLSFPSFVFSCDRNSSWDVSVIQDFLVKWDKNIKEVTFDSVALTSKCNLTNTEVLIPSYDITPLFINPSNITSLKLKHPEFVDPKTTMDISLEKFVSLKTLSLNDCRIIISSQYQNALIAPLNINFQRVIGCVQNEEINFHYNDLVDFSKALNINLENFRGLGVEDDPIIGTFDMGKHVLNLNQLHLADVSLQNWVEAKGDVQLCHFYNIPFEEKNELQIKQLLFNKSKIDLSALPQTLEILQLAEGDFSEIDCSEPLLHLPNLKYLSIFGKDSNILPYFSNCASMEELLVRCKPQCSSAPIPNPCTFTRVPESVKRMTLEVFPIEFAENCIYEVDTLILKYRRIFSRANDCTAITAHIKAKELIIVFWEADLDIDTSDIVKLVLANTQSQKIIISANSDLHSKTPFEGSEFSKYVDKKSNIYQFENNVGKSITEKEFPRYAER